MSQTMYSSYKNASSESILYEFQKEALNNASGNYLYALDTGTGKTITSLHHYLKFSNGEPLIIFAPAQKVKEGGWERDIEFIEKHYNIKIPHRVISYGVLAKQKVPSKQFFVIFDEAHYIKNPTSQRGKVGQQFAKAATHFCLLTATPLSNGWEDSYNYFIMFGYFRNKTDMNRQHAVYEDLHFGPKVVKKIVAWRNEALLKSYFNRFTVSISKDDALDLPPLVERRVNFQPSKEYKTLRKTRVLNDEAFDNIPKLIHGLRYWANQEDKLSYIEMLLQGTNRNVIIFYQYKEEYERLHETALKLGKQIYVVNGKASHLPPRDIWASLKSSVTLVQYQSGSSGIELQYASEVVFYTPTYSYQDYEQSLGRAYRNGQTKKVTVYQFETQHTIESEVWEALANKKDFSTQLYAMTKLGG